MSYSSGHSAPPFPRILFVYVLSYLIFAIHSLMSEYRYIPAVYLRILAIRGLLLWTRNLIALSSFALHEGCLWSNLTDSPCPSFRGYLITHGTSSFLQPSVRPTASLHDVRLLKLYVYHIHHTSSSCPIESLVFRRSHPRTSLCNPEGSLSHRTRRHATLVASHFLTYLPLRYSHS